MAFLGDFFVVFFVKKSGWFWVVLDFKEPSFFSQFVNSTGVSSNLFINFDNPTRNGTVDIGGHFDAFYSHGRISRFNVFANSG